VALRLAVRLLLKVRNLLLPLLGLLQKPLLMLPLDHLKVFLLVICSHVRHVRVSFIDRGALLRLKWIVCQGHVVCSYGNLAPAGLALVWLNVAIDDAGNDLNIVLGHCSFLGLVEACSACKIVTNLR